MRYGRQTRLPEIGDDGQARLSAARVKPGGAGDARLVEEAYLAAAGVHVDAGADVDPSADTEAKTASAALGVRDPSAREVAEGAMRALVAMRRILGVTE